MRGRHQGRKKSDYGKTVEAISAHLRRNPQGLSVLQLASLTGLSAGGIYSAIKKNPALFRPSGVFAGAGSQQRWALAAAEPADEPLPSFPPAAQ